MNPSLESVALRFGIESSRSSIAESKLWTASPFTKIECSSNPKIRQTSLGFGRSGPYPARSNMSLRSVTNLAFKLFLLREKALVSEGNLGNLGDRSPSFHRNVPVPSFLPRFPEFQQ
jgi:hypothetical protein